MERTGEVIEVSGKYLIVQFCRPSDCEKCGACHGGKSQTQIQVEGDARVGDQVTVEMPSSRVLKASALAYVVPLAGLMGGMFLGTALPLSTRLDQNMLALIGGLIGLGAALGIVKLCDRRLKNQKDWQPRLVRVNQDTPAKRI